MADDKGRIRVSVELILEMQKYVLRVSVCVCVIWFEHMWAWKCINLQQPAVCVHMGTRAFVFINPSLSVGWPVPLLSLHLQREGHTFQRCFPTLALGDAQPELISDRGPSPHTGGPPPHLLTHTHTHTSSPHCPSVHRHAAREFCPLPHFCPPPPHPSPLPSSSSLSARDVEVFKEIDWSLIFVLAWSVTLLPAPTSLSSLYIYELDWDVRSGVRKLKWEINQSWRVI